LPDDGLILNHLEDNLKSTRKFVASIPANRFLHRYAEGKWTIKEILGHIVDDERIYVYRHYDSRGTIPRNFRDSSKTTMPDIPTRTNANHEMFSTNSLWCGNRRSPSSRAWTT